MFYKEKNTAKKNISLIIAIFFILSSTGYSYAASNIRVRMGEDTYSRFIDTYIGPEDTDEALSKLLARKKPRKQSNVKFLEKWLADIESRNLTGRWGGVSYSTGMSAVKESIFTLINLSKVDPNKANLVVFRPSYACTDNLFKQLEKLFDVRYVSTSAEVEGRVDENTVLVFCETVANPTLVVIDIEEVCETIASKNKDITLICDNTFATPLGMQPLKHAERYNVNMLIMQSITKGLSGTGNVLGGILIGKNKIIRKLRKRKGVFLRPLTEKDAETTVRYGLPLLQRRLTIQSANAEKYVENLKNQPLLDNIIYPGDSNHPQHDVAQRLMGNFGHMISLDFGTGEQGKKKAHAFMNLLRYFRTLEHAVSLGHVRNLLNLASDATHITLSEQDKEQGGISPAGIRWSVGIEDPEDVLRELNTIFEILETYENDLENIPYEVLDSIFMAEYNDVSEGKTHLIRKYPVINRVRNAYEIEPMIRNAIAMIGDNRMGRIAEKINESTLITKYKAQTWACHHGWLSSLISGNHPSVTDSGADATSLRAKNAVGPESMADTFVSILSLSDGKSPLQLARRRLYGRLGTASSLTLEILIVLLEVGAKDAFSGKYAGLSASSLNDAIDQTFLNVIFETDKKKDGKPVKVISFTSKGTPLDGVTKDYKDGWPGKLKNQENTATPLFDFNIFYKSDILEHDEDVDFVFVDEKRHSGLSVEDINMIKQRYPSAKICWINTEGIRKGVQPIKSGLYKKGAYLSIVGLNDINGNDVGAVIVVPYKVATSSAWTLKNSDRAMRPTEAHGFLVNDLAYLLTEGIVPKTVRNREIEFRKQPFLFGLQFFYPRVDL